MLYLTLFVQLSDKNLDQAAQIMVYNAHEPADARAKKPSEKALHQDMGLPDECVRFQSYG